MLNGLDLLSGIGGLTVALSPWVRPIAYCEADIYCRGVLLSRMQCLDLPQGPIWDDVRTLRRQCLDLPVDIIYGGFPCQDISLAGNGAGLEGERSGLVFELLRLVEECKPAFVFLENVPAIRTRGGERVGKALARLGFDCRWTVVSAAEVGAPHLRKRWFLLAAHPERLKLREQPGRGSGSSGEGLAFPTPDGAPQLVADSDGEGESQSHGCLGEERQRSFDGSRGSPEPDVGRVAHGVPKRVDRLRALGNAVVPAQAREAFERLMGLKEVM